MRKAQQQRGKGQPGCHENAALVGGVRQRPGHQQGAQQATHSHRGQQRTVAAGDRESHCIGDLRRRELNPQNRRLRRQDAPRHSHNAQLVAMIHESVGINEKKHDEDSDRRNPDGSVPFDEWLATLTRPSKTQNLAAAGRLKVAVRRLATEGHELRRPTSAPLRDGIHELRVEVRNINFRVLYFFAGSGVAVLAHGCTKEGNVEKADVERAVARRLAYEANPTAHTAPPL